MSLALYSFDGSVRRNKAAEAIVDDLKSRERFLAKIDQERDERAQETRRNNAAVKIQSYFRSYSARKGVKSQLRLAFDHVCAGAKNNKIDVNTLNEQIARLVLFHSPAIDQHRLVWTCQACLAAAQENGRDAIAASKRFPLYKCCLRHLDQISADASAAFAPALRLLEVFAFVDDAETARLVSVGYFVCIRRLFEKRVPLPADEHLEVVDRLPSPMAEGIASSLLRPILALRSFEDEAFRQKILRRFCSDVLDGDESRHVVCYLVPYIGNQVERQLLPFADMLASLLPRDWWQFLSEDKKPFLELKVQSPVLFGYVLLQLAYRFPLEGCTARVKQMFLLCLSCTLQAVAIPTPQAKDNDDDEEENEMDVDDFASRTPGTAEFLLSVSINALQTPKIREALLSAALEPPTAGAVTCLARVCYFVSGHKKRSELHSALIYSLSFKAEFTRRLWHLIKHCASPTIFGQPRPLLDNLVRGMPLTQDEKDRLIPLLSLFCSLMVNTLLAVHDDEFFKEDIDRPLTSLVPFSIRDLCLVTDKMRNVALGLIDLAFPDSRTDLMPKIGVRHKEPTENPIEWNALFNLVVQLLQLLHERDARLQFMAPDFWSNHNRKVVVNRQVFHSRRRGVSRQRERPFTFVRWLTHEEMEAEDGVQPTAVDLRNVTIMRRIPFVVPFLERVQIFQELLNHDKQEINRMDEWGGALHSGDAIYLRVRRNYLYEDAFENLSPVNAPTIKKQIRVSMTNWAGLDEAGIDGGGIFREFLSELLKSGFDPQRGFFTTTPHDRLLYPSPVAVKLFPDDFSRHYYFLGRMLGKLIYENQMAELRFASFFLAKLVHKSDENVDIHHLASLDPDLYKNLLYVKQYTDDVSKLELDFSVVVEHLGQVEKIELKPGGSNMRVDNSNRIEYIHLLANYYLNDRLRPATRAMRAGLSDVLDLDWLGMFDHREMQILISGADSDVDVSDMRKFVVIHNMQSDDDNRVVDTFWRVVQSFSPVEKRKLLKFVTGCSRPPLMGFKDLYPPMGIQLVPDSDRLPSAATCMNLLKLPKFRDQQTMYTKLVYAIEAGAGFELS